jgi:hypothetical protein
MDIQETPKENQNIAIDKKSPPEADQRLAGKILFIIVGLLIVGSVAVTFWRYMIRRDYIVQAQTDCDPTTENCFIWECDPESTVEGEACTGDPELDTWYYKIIHRNAKNIPDCDPNDENCTALVCDPGEKDCAEELCTDENVSEGEFCSDPVQYNLDNPPEEDSEECAEDDEECLAEEESAECEEGDEECLAEEDSAAFECAPEDQECLDAQDSEGTEDACAPDDPECLDAQGAEANPENPGSSVPVLMP